MKDLSDQLLRWKELRPNYELWRDKDFDEIFGIKRDQEPDKSQVREFLKLDKALRSEITWTTNHVVSNPVAQQILSKLIESQRSWSAEGEVVEDDLAWDLLLSTYSPQDYAHRMLFSKRLLLLFAVPESLVHLADELREVYCLGLNTATASLSRTLVEAAISDIAVMIGRIDNEETLADTGLCGKISSLVGKRNPLRDRIDDFMEDSSRVIHATDSADASVAAGLFEKALTFVQELYGRYRATYLDKQK